MKNLNSDANVVYFDPNEVETCVKCHKDTIYKKGDHIDYRYNYIKGGGQLCPECAKELGV